MPRVLKQAPKRKSRPRHFTPPSDLVHSPGNKENYTIPKTPSHCGVFWGKLYAQHWGRTATAEDIQIITGVSKDSQHTILASNQPRSHHNQGHELRGRKRALSPSDTARIASLVKDREIYPKESSQRHGRILLLTPVLSPQKPGISSPLSTGLVKHSQFSGHARRMKELATILWKKKPIESSDQKATSGAINQNCTITDFGCASEEKEIEYDWPGTVPYLAPEQVEKQTHGPPVDCLACGLIGSELIRRPRSTGRLWPGEQLEILQTWLSESNSSIADCCEAMLDPHPNSRMTIKQAVAQIKSNRNQETVAVFTASHNEEVSKKRRY
ncbi:uncharacterized protein BDZ99DRAFT_482542 [Mytilinidion resinicola]|uniref:Protein kinase domain-containing protein n=1 Tax=Mytilinidion resinicola TaxID=574789 RepID=A0A6A6Y2J5_9PEZI|nr:uncharacterized protein BDZ99DRAFT_482542 [Mytilinidion resinicola]KAF2803012.1 hypothetical protein BDZ99DRAFT_482542 [Mytilinidion resinicola]